MLQLRIDPQRTPTPANRLRIDYHAPPARKVAGRIVDFHTHSHGGRPGALMKQAAEAYGVSKFLSMTPLGEVDAVRTLYGDAVEFIAIPSWREISVSEAFRTRWTEDLATFHGHGARLAKLWMAPRMRREHGLTADHPFVRPVVDAALELGFELMIHVADPGVWWAPGARYAADPAYGSKAAQYDQLAWLLEYVRPRRVVAAHMGGSVEDPAFLQSLLDRYDNLRLDMSATKWIVREVARRPEAVRELIVRNADRVLFGSDLVASPAYTDFDHYASRYWAHQVMWESDYRGESPIEDPDGEDPPRLAGVDLPAEVLERVYDLNAREFGL